MDCVSSSCWLPLPPEAPPPPPLPDFLPPSVMERLGLNLTSGGCELCAWAAPAMTDPSASGAIPISSLLALVAIVSALAGAGLTVTALSIRRCRSRRRGTSPSVRHLDRKRNEGNSAGTSSSSGFTNSALSENTYCEGPYNDKEACNNIYAELHPAPAALNIRTRPPLPVPPPTENCYLELNDLPCHSRSMGRGCMPAEESSNSSDYYADLDLERRTVRPV